MALAVAVAVAVAAAINPRLSPAEWRPLIGPTPGCFSNPINANVKLNPTNIIILCLCFEIMIQLKRRFNDVSIRLQNDLNGRLEINLIRRKGFEMTAAFIIGAGLTV